MPLTLGALWGVLCADVLQSLEYQTRPYEVEKGATDRAIERSVGYLYEAFKKRPQRGKAWSSLLWHLSTNYFVNALREVKKNFDSIEVDRLQCKPVVKITGEFYLQTVEEDPNYNIHRWLESEGAEVYPAPVAVWLDYWMRFYVQIFMDSGIGHEIEADLQAHGYPILWLQYVPTDADIMEWIFGDEIRDGHISSPFDIRDVWTSSYSANTNELLWGAKVAARMPWISCAIRLTSYECGMDQPTFSSVLQIVERSGTLFFSFQELDSTKPAGSVKIRVETIAHYLGRNSQRIIEQKKLAMRPPFPLKEASGAAS
jgi:hypothetical protein